MELLFLNGTLLPMTASGDEDKLRKAALGVVGNRIEMLSDNEQEIADFQKKYPSLKVIDCQGKLVMPGLINTHCHTGMTLQRSNADDIGLMEWLNEHIWPFESYQTPQDIALGMKLGIVEMLLGGTTSFVDMYFHQEETVDVVKQMGIRALLGEDVLNLNFEEISPRIEKVIEKTKGQDVVRAAVAAHSPYTCKKQSVIDAKAFARKHGLIFMTHIAETKDETKIILDRHGLTPVRYMDSIGVLDENTIAAHCIHLDDEEVDIMAKRGVAVSHNPQSNLKVANAVCHVEKLRQRGVLVTLATDGACSNNDLDMFEELRSATLLQKMDAHSPMALPAYEALKLATVNGAKAIGYRHGELGVLQVGALADIIVLDMQKPHMQPEYNIIGNLVYAGKATDVETVVVNGRILVENRQVLGVDLKELYQQVNQTVNRIDEQMHKK